jgi:hypothetical protein
MSSKSTKRSTGEEVFLGYRIRKLDGVYIAVPLDWAGDRGETLAASDLQTLRKEIRRWWYQVGA